MTQVSPAIELIGIEKEFSSHGDIVKAVAGVDIEIGAGEFFSLLGPSGCGKTTTMRIIAGFEEPTRGEVRLYGQSVLGVPPNKRDVNMVFQSYALFPHMSVSDNVAFGLRRKGVDKAEVDKRVGEILETVGLTGREKRMPRELSGGQQQRVALARALVNRPRALLLDEPLGALDLKLRQAMQIELKRIQREVGITFIYVTHDQGEALTMSDRIAVMNEGLVEQLGSPRDIYEHPASKFVAGFIGTSNLLSGTVQSVSDTSAIVLEGGDQHIEVPLREGVMVTAGSTVELTVRPEKIGLSTAVPAAGLCRLRGTVTEVVYLGTSTNYNVLTSTGDEVTVFLQNAANADDLAARGQEVWLCWEPRHAYVIEVR
ncbi:MAG TPA: ABC transporter ATP-binding protein [Streptosporangiaceae bacterium]|jgi:spermidine/putrescine transport system ATP-binding protein